MQRLKAAQDPEGKRQFRANITPSKAHYRKGGRKYVRVKASVECHPRGSCNHWNHDLETGHVHCTTQEWPCLESMEVRRERRVALPSYAELFVEYLIDSGRGVIVFRCLPHAESTQLRQTAPNLHHTGGHWLSGMRGRSW